MDKLEAQMRLVFDAMAEHGITIGVELARGNLDYLYEEGCLLVRDRHLTRVREVVGGGDVTHGLIDGVSLYTLDGAQLNKVTSALAVIDRTLGTGVAAPNHAFSVTQAEGNLCPACEPVPVSPDTPVTPAPRHSGGGTGAHICVVDTGLVAEATDMHPWLAGVTGDEEKLPADANGQVTIPPYASHGTFIAGVAKCVAPGADVRVLNEFSVAGVTLESSLMLALERAWCFNPDIISLSAGGTTRGDLPPLGLSTLLERYRQRKGTLIVAAAGNNGERRPFWPAAFTDVLAVGALDQSGRRRAPWTGYGPWVDVYAPGTDLVNAFASGTYTCTEPPSVGEVRSFSGLARWSGTSFATPLVAGLVADRMTRTGCGARQAAGEMLLLARECAIPGVGPVLLPLRFTFARARNG
jgi:subtilisin family serine protease